MNSTNFTTTLMVEQTPKEAFRAVNNVRGWWSEQIEGSTNKLNDEWSYHYKDIHSCKMKIVEFVPDKRVVWLVMENHFNFTKALNEWIGNRIIFEINKKDNKTQIQFTQVGLVHEYECFDICSKAWTQYIQQSLSSLITTGKGLPNSKESEVRVK